MNNKFDLERFKAGEMAETQDYRYWFFAELPDGNIACKGQHKGTGTWFANSNSLSCLQKKLTMTPVEEFIVVDKNWRGGMSFERAEKERRKLGDNYITVKIVRP